MLIAVAYSLRYERLENLEFSIKNTWLYEEEVDSEFDEDEAAISGIIEDMPE